MATKALDTYLNDHLAGAMLGTDLAEQIKEHNEGTPLGDRMATISDEIEHDRQVLIGLMESVGTSKNPVKQVTTWVAEKASRPKFSGFTSGDPELGTFLALEHMSLGVLGKLKLWRALERVQGSEPALAQADLAGLAARAESQHEALEEERLAAAKRVLAALAEASA